MENTGGPKRPPVAPGETNTDFSSHLTLNKTHTESILQPNGETYSNYVPESVDVGHMDRHTEHHDETVVTTSWEVTTETFDWVSDYTAGSTPGATGEGLDSPVLLSIVT